MKTSGEMLQPSLHSNYSLLTETANCLGECSNREVNRPQHVFMGTFQVLGLAQDPLRCQSWVVWKAEPCCAPGFDLIPQLQGILCIAPLSPSLEK